MTDDQTLNGPINQTETGGVARRLMTPEERAKRNERMKAAREARKSSQATTPAPAPEPQKVYMSHGVKIPQIIPVRRTSVFNLRS